MGRHGGGGLEGGGREGRDTTRGDAWWKVVYEIEWRRSKEAICEM